MGGHPVVVYGRTGGAYRVDDRSLAALTVPMEQFDAARARVGSYKNLLLAPVPNGDVPAVTLRSAVLSGITDCADRLGGTSSSFAFQPPPWMMTMTGRLRAAFGE